MADRKVQANHANVGAGPGTGTCTFTGAQTGGNMNSCRLWCVSFGAAPAAGDITSVTDLNGAYAFRKFHLHAAINVGVWIYDYIGIAARLGGVNAVSVVWTSTAYLDIFIQENLPVTGYIDSVGDYQYGGTARAPTLTFPGTTAAGQWVDGIAYNGQSTTPDTVNGTVDGAAAFFGDDDGGADKVATMTGDVLDTSADVVFGTVTTDNWVAAAAAYSIAGGGGAAGAPLIVRRTVEYSFPIDERMRRARPVLPPTLTPDVAPLLTRRLFEIAPNDELARRVRLSSASLVALASTPFIARRAVQEQVAEEDANRVKPVPLPLQADTALLPARRATQDVRVPDERAARAPLVAPSVDFAPLQGRRATERTIPDEQARRFNQQPAPSSDFAPLLGRRAVEIGQPDERAMRAPLVAPSVDLPPLTVRRTYEDGITWERAGVRVFAPVAPVAVSVPVLQARARQEDTGEETARRARALPPPGTVDSPSLRQRRPGEETVRDEAVFRPVHPVPQSGIAPGVSALLQRRSAEEVVPDERVRRVQALPSPQTADVAPLQVRRQVEGVGSEEQARRASLPAASSDSPPVLPRRAEDVAGEERAARRVQVPAQSSDSPPLLPRRWREDVQGEEMARRYVPVPARADAPPLLVRRLQDVAAPDERARRAPLVVQGQDVAPLPVRRAREEITRDETFRVRRGVPRSPLPDVAPFLPRKWYRDDSLPDERVTRPRYLVAITIPLFAGGCAHVDYLVQSARSSFALQSAHASSYLC